MEMAHARKLRLALAILLILLPLITILAILGLRGPQWDVVAHSLNGRTLLNYLSLRNESAKSVFVGEYLNNMIYYFEPYRAPLAIPIFAFLSIFLAEPIIAYTILLYAGVVFALYSISKELKVDYLIIFSAFLSPYALYFFFVPNSMEGLSLIFIMFGLVYLLRKSPWSGLFFGIASLAKYPPLILLPIVLLLWDRKKIAFALALEALAIAPWLAFNYAIYGHALYSYVAALSNIVIASNYTPVYPLAILVTIAYPIAFLAGAAILARQQKPNKGLHAMRAISYKYKVLLTFAILATIGYAFVLPHNDFFTQERFGYMLSTSLAILGAVLLYDLMPGRRRLTLPQLVAIAAIAILAINLYYTYATTNTAAIRYYNPDIRGNVFQNAEAELASMGFGGCRFVSNAWVQMLYLHYNAYSPFILYKSSIITPLVEGLSSRAGINYAAYVKGQTEYPVVVIDNAGVPPTLILNLKNSTLVYNNSQIQIYLPRNASCYTSD